MLVALRVTRGQSDSGDFVLFITYLAQVRVMLLITCTPLILEPEALRTLESTWICLSISEPVIG